MITDTHHTHDTGPSLFEDLVAGLAALDDRATLRITVDVEGEQREFVVPADGTRLDVGRAGDADIVVTVAQASRRHAEVRSDAGTVSCHDAGSTYGTWIERDGQRLQVPADLIGGDRIVTAGDAVLFTMIEIS
jgi:pSer/pThr/pTyr-binding forkhead associated (FHA) protein